MLSLAYMHHILKLALLIVLDIDIECGRIGPVFVVVSELLEPNWTEVGRVRKLDWLIKARAALRGTTSAASHRARAAMPARRSDAQTTELMRNEAYIPSCPSTDQPFFCPFKRQTPP
jgi:hypothetical protein